MRSWISTAHCKDRGFLILIFVFMLSILLVVSRRGIHTSDGYIEFLVAQRWTESGELDLPKYENLPDSRVQRGVDGKYYSVYGIGNSVLFAVTITMDKALIDLIGSINRSGFDFGPPFLFSIAANAFVLALTGVYLWRILKLLGIASDPALLASTLYVFTSMALVYSTLSFDISLACLMLLLMLFYLFRYHETGLKKNLLLAGAAFGSQVITRFSFAAFVLPVLYALMWRGPGNREEAKTAPSRMALFLIAVIPFGLWI
ncbi:MAG: glycosyltransferase family 39 protein, partial [Anaerolineales bacterium]|nr:glycosyltransferase family 39 protein [Anaerolineales bacterium]